MTSHDRREAGFTLVEMLMAVLITLLISGAVYGLMAGGQNAFRREPALTDRQQNIRSAMLLIQRDLAVAGMGLPAFFQVFTRGLDGTGPAAFPSVVRPGQRADGLEVYGNEGACPTVAVCDAEGINVRTAEPLPACYRVPGLMFIGPAPGSVNRGGGLHYAVRESRDNNCAEKLQFQSSGSPWNPPGGFCGPGDPPCEQISGVSLLRYEIAPDADGVPALWRSATGRTDASGLDVNVPPPGGNWRLVATGIEDLQVDYQNGLGTWASDPGEATCLGDCSAPTVAEWNTIVRQVRITLSARTVNAANLQGQTTAGGVTAVHGQLTTVSAPLAAHIALSRANTPTGPLWR